MTNKNIIRNERILQIKRAIVEINNPLPPDDFITCYKDFLKARDCFHLYKYNPNVLQALLDLACDLWDTKERISRITLLQTIKKYGFKKEKGGIYNPNNIDLKARRKVFLLFKYCFEKPEFIPERQIEEIRNICNYILIDLKLSEVEEKWFCKNADKDDLIFKRTAGYTKKSEIISKWAIENYDSKQTHIYRIEMASWLIDKNLEYQIEKQMVIDDFEYLNEIDIKTTQDYEEELIVIKQEIEEVFGSGLAEFETDGDDSFLSYNLDPILKLKLKRRFYYVPIHRSLLTKKYIPNFVELRTSFYAEVDKNVKITNLWAIALSRLDKKTKSQVLKKHYDEETYWSFFRICKKYKLIDLLEWLREKQNELS